jgi:hypothetical protein
MDPQAYGRQFHVRRFRTYDLQKPGVLATVMALGYRYVRRSVKDYVDIVRNPTMGCIVEMSYVPMPYFMPLTSREGQRLVKCLSYF